MTRELILKETIEKLNQLPDSKLLAVSEFAEFLFEKIESDLLTKGIEELASKSNSFSFLAEDSVEYKRSDLKKSS